MPRAAHKIAAPEITAASVAKIFRETYKQGPWPTEAQCYGLAVRADATRRISVDLNARRQVSADRRALRSAVACIRTLTGKYRDIASPLSLPGDRAVRALLAALDGAEETVFGFVDGDRDSSWWHRHAAYLAGALANTLIDAGAKKISRAKGGPFVKTMRQLLRVTTGKDFEEGTIAQALKNLPAN